MPNDFTMGTNIRGKVEGDILTLTVDLTVRGELSASQKSRQVASSHGNQRIPGTEVTAGINLYVKP